MRRPEKSCAVAVSGWSRIVPYAAILVLVMVAQAQAQSMLTHHVRPAVASGKAQFLYRMSGTDNLRVDIVLPLHDSVGLDNFLAEVYDPASPSFRHFLTVQEFTERFGPSQADFDTIVRYAERNGFKVLGGSRESRDLQLEGSVTSVEAAFNVNMGVYLHPTENRTFYAPDREPTVNLPMPLWHVSGLDNFAIPPPAGLHHRQGPNSNATLGSGPSQSFLGSDMRAAYYGTGFLNGAGQYLGLLEFAGYDSVDLTTYFTNAHQTLNVPITGISTDGTSLSCVYRACDDTEPILDITQAVSMAPGLASLYFFVGSSDTALLSHMASTTPLAAQLSSSWTWQPGDPGTDDPYFKQFAAQGQNFFQAAGDSASYTSSSSYVFPADDDYLTSVGGTDLTTQSAGGPWASETAWVDGGGGYFTVDNIPIPSWQQTTGVITATNQGSSTLRNSPDVSANANFTYYVCADQTTCTANSYGGTSFAAPLWAGYMALVNQQSIANGGKSLGFINSSIYSIGLGSSYSTAFHDVTSGSNGRPAVAGYDLATGWGSMNGTGLITALVGASTTPNFSLSASPSSVSAPQGGNATSTITSTVVNGFNSTITLAASGMPTGVTAGFSNGGTITGAGSSVLTLTVGSSTAAGTYKITVTGTSGSLVQTTTVSLTVTAVTPNFTITPSVKTISVTRSSSSTATVTTVAVNGFNAAISLSSSGAPSGVTVSFSPTSIAAPGSGSSTIKFTATSRASTGTRTITVKGTGGGKTNSTTISLTVVR